VRPADVVARRVATVRPADDEGDWYDEGIARAAGCALRSEARRKSSPRLPALAAARATGDWGAPAAGGLAERGIEIEVRAADDCICTAEPGALNTDCGADRRPEADGANDGPPPGREPGDGNDCRDGGCEADDDDDAPASTDVDVSKSSSTDLVSVFGRLSGVVPWDEDS
jgi:hypothetical protein